MSDWDRDLGITEFAGLVEGKTVASVDELSNEEAGWTDQGLRLTFTDGTAVVIKSWDYEGYSSGLYKWGEPRA